MARGGAGCLSGASPRESAQVSRAIRSLQKVESGRACHPVLRVASTLRVSGEQVVWPSR